MVTYLVDVLLEVERGLDGLEGRAPLGAARPGHVLEHDAAAALVLVLHQLHGVLALLRRVLREEVREAVQGHVVAAEVGRLQQEEEE